MSAILKVIARGAAKLAEKVAGREALKAAEEALEHVVEKFGGEIEERVLKPSAKMLEELGFRTGSAREFMHSLVTTVEKTIADEEMEKRLITLAQKLTPEQRQILQKALREYANHVARKLRLRTYIPMSVIGAAVGGYAATQLTPRRREYIANIYNTAFNETWKTLSEELRREMPELGDTSAEAYSLANILSTELTAKHLGWWMYTFWWVPKPHKIAQLVARQSAQIVHAVTEAIKQFASTYIRTIDPNKLKALLEKEHIPNRANFEYIVAQYVSNDPKVRQFINKLVREIAEKYGLDNDELLNQLKEQIEYMLIHYLTTRYKHYLMNVYKQVIYS